MDELTPLSALTKYIKKITFINTLSSVITLVLVAVIVLKGFNSNSPSSVSYDQSVFNSDCNIQVIPLHGFLDTSEITYSDGSKADVTSTEIITQIMDAASNNQIKGIVIDVDSGGGSPTAGSEIAAALAKFNKPNAAWARSLSASAAFWSVVSSKRIFANENSEVGSIGITSSYLDMSKKNANDGANFQQISVGKFKDTGNPNKPLSEEEKNLLLNEDKDIYTNFIQDVAHYRNLNIKKVENLADGAVMVATKALNAGLIDQIGDLNDIENYMSAKIGAKAQFCWK